MRVAFKSPALRARFAKVGFSKSPHGCVGRINYTCLASSQYSASIGLHACVDRMLYRRMTDDRREHAAADHAAACAHADGEDTPGLAAPCPGRRGPMLRRDARAVARQSVLENNYYVSASIGGVPFVCVASIGGVVVEIEHTAFCSLGSRSEKRGRVRGAVRVSTVSLTPATVLNI